MISRNQVLCAAVVVASLMGGCGGGGGGGDSGLTGSSGDLTTSMTDANAASVTAFVVPILRVTMTRNDGTVVEALPLTVGATVDFADAHELAELVSSVQLPFGSYVSMTITADFSNAVMQLVDGSTLTAAQGNLLVDVNGTPTVPAAGQTTAISVAFANQFPLIVAPGVPAHLLIEFDLSSALEFDVPAAGQVTVKPTFHADTQLQRPKQTRIRGLLKAVDTTGQTFTLEVHPLGLLFTPRQVTIGINTTNNPPFTLTEFNGDGQTGTGAAGLAQLASAPTNTPVVVWRARFDPSIHRFRAGIVDYGSSVLFLGGNRDFAEGLVTDFNGALGVYTVRGLAFVHSNPTASALVRNVTVNATINGSTLIFERGVSGTVTADAINVGQHVWLIGVIPAFTPPTLTMDCTSALNPTATPGRVRLTETGVGGLVVTTSASTVTLNVRRFNARPVGQFNLVGHGITPTAYVVNANGLALGSILGGDPVAARGTVNAVSARAAGGADFNANTLIDFANSGDLLFAKFTTTGTAQPFGATPPSSFPVTITPPTQWVRRLDVFTGLNNTSTAISISSTPTGPFVIFQNGSQTIYEAGQSQAWLTDVNSRLATKKAFWMGSTGLYNASTHAFTAQAIAIGIH